jgi:ABC-type branched-subunit amino acid transport system ATPase component
MNPMTSPADDAVLEVQHLTKTFGALVSVNDLSFGVRRGQVKSIIGPNGAGKTTLFNLIAGMLKPDRGRIIFRSRDITHLRPHHIAQRGIVRSFQIVHILPMLTAFENIRLALQSRTRGIRRLIPVYTRREMEERVDQILESVQLADHRDTLAANLSHGQQKHLEFGMTLAMEPDLMLLDEPTAGMTPSESRQTVQLIKALGAGKTVLLVEHDMIVVEDISDVVMVLHYGAKIAEGAPQDVLKNRDVIEAYFGG